MTNCHEALKHIEVCETCYEKAFEYFKAESAAIAGSTRSYKKAKAARENGKKGGRPVGSRNKPK